MSYSVRPGSALGRLGAGIGAGLSEQIPKEIGRHRLAQGLKQLQGQNLTPMEFLTQVASVPGALEHPQLIQSLGELAKQEARGKALSGQARERPERFPGIPGASPSEAKAKTASITTPEDLERIIQGFIPPSQQDIFNEASNLYNSNPGLFDYNPDKAIAAAKEKFSQEESQYKAFQEKHKILSDVQDNVVKRLRDHSNTLGVEIPPDTYSKIEDEAIKATRPKNMGGGGKTEQQAMKDFGEILDEVSRQYKDVETLSSFNPLSLKRKIKSLQSDFSKRDDTRNLALQLINKLGISAPLAYKFAEPVSDIPDLKNEFDKIKNIAAPEFGKEIQPQIFERLIKAMGTKGSPLAIAYELNKKGYSPWDWLDYLNAHRENLTGKQTDQLNKGFPNFWTTKDLWIKAWGD